jgi:aerobic-type carbon monoxide dehydrogenase small subunit (CoxS/CutS family)
VVVEIRLVVNGTERDATVAEDELLCDTLRGRLGLTGTKVGCREGVCGSCDVEMDGLVVRSCLILSAQSDGSVVTTVEGLASGQLSALQEAFVAHGAAQCGFCTSGMLVAASAALRTDADLVARDPAAALAGNLCRCTGYAKIVDAVRSVAGRAHE